MDNLEIQNTIEALLFACGESCEYTRLAEALGITPEEARLACADMAAGYNARPGGLELVFYADSVQLVTRPAYSGLVKALLQQKRSATLSKPALEVLAVIAYNQPVTRAFIEQIRGGVDCGALLASLMEKELIEERGRLDVPGKPYLFGTTEVFLRVFGLRSLLELPPIESFTIQKPPEE